MKHRTDFPEIEYKTEQQWKREKKVPCQEAVPVQLWTNPYHSMQKLYYTPEQVREMTEEEKLDCEKETKEKYLLQRQRTQKRLEEIERRKRKREQQEIEERVLSAKREVGYHLGKELLRISHNTPSIKCNNKPRAIVFDIETTGLDCETDEILQISIIDGDGNVLLDEYIRPYWSMEWPEAEAVHGITYEFVKHASYAHELIPKIRGIFEAANVLIGYNTYFDLGFLNNWGIESIGKEIIDVMQDFSCIYGEWNDYFQDYKSQKLETCARFFNYEFSAHDSLEDCKATLFCYNAMKKKEVKDEE